MTDELNYLNEKIESVQSDIDYLTRELSISENIEDRRHFSEMLEQCETEKEYLNNILNAVITL